MAIGNPNYNALLSTTLANYRSQFSDNLSGAFFLYWWLTRMGKKTQNGGESIVIQLMYGKNSTVRSYNGYDVIDTTPQEGLTAANFPWKQVSGTVSISGKERKQNKGEAQLINLLEAKIKQTEITFRDQLNEMFFGDGTGNSSKDIFGLQLLCEDGSPSWGTLAGIDRSDALNAWWRPQTADHGGGAISPAGMRTSYNNASRGNEHPDIGITDQTRFEAYEGILQQNERFTSKEVGDAGFENLKFKGCILGYDANCPSGYLYFLNSNYLEYIVESDTDLVQTEFQEPINQDAMVAKILLMANLCGSNFARQAVRYNIGT